MNQPRLLGTASQVGIAVCALLGIALFAFVDLTPEVEADFFFSTDDPQLHGFRRIEQEFGSAPQIFISVHSPQLVSRTYLLRLLALTEDLRRLDGVADVRSVTRGPEQPEDISESDPKEVFEDLSDSPFWSRLLLAPDGSATFIVLRLAAQNHDAIVATYRRPARNVSS